MFVHMHLVYDQLFVEFEMRNFVSYGKSLAVLMMIATGATDASWATGTTNLWSFWIRARPSSSPSTI